MSVAPIVDLLRAQATVAHNLFVDLTRLHADVRLNGLNDVLPPLDALLHNARHLLDNLDLINDTLTPPGPKRAQADRDCPDQLPLWHDGPANLES